MIVPTKISYCITCKRRLSYLKKTLPANLEIEIENDNVEFLVLDYDSDDGLKEWLFNAFQTEILKGKVRYSHFAPAPYFRMAHAKNLAHLASTGEILCSLDADNLIAPGFTDWLLSEYGKNKDFIASPRLKSFSGYVWQRWVEKRLGMRAYESGLGGRIALSRKSFLILGGYKETMSGWGGDDLEFMLRARDNGLLWKSIPKNLWGRALEHSPESRIVNLTEADALKSGNRLQRSAIQEALDAWREYRNTSRVPFPIDNATSTSIKILS